MSRYIKTLLVLGLVAGVAACAAPVEQEEIIFIEPAPIVHEPVSNKYH